MTSLRVGIAQGQKVKHTFPPLPLEGLQDTVVSAVEIEFAEIDQHDCGVWSGPRRMSHERLPARSVRVSSDGRWAAGGLNCMSSLLIYYKIGCAVHIRQSSCEDFQIRIWIDGIKYDLAHETIGMDLRSGDWTRTKSDDELTEEDLANARSTAILFSDQGQTDEAQAMYLEVIAVRTAKLGAEHVDTISAKGKLATLLDEQGQTDEAKAMLLEVIAGYTAKLGVDHVSTVRAKMNLAILLDEQGQTDEAQAMYLEVIAGYTAKLGAEHVDTIRAKMNLGLLYETALHDYEKAKEIYEECVTKFTVKLGEHHPLTQKAKDNLQYTLDALEPEPES